MAVQDRLTMTAEEFDRFAERPENRDKRLEFIGGEIIEVVSNNYASLIAARLLMRLGTYIEAHNLGLFTGADGGYMVFGDRVIPDVAFISFVRQPKPSHETYNPNAPDLAVEVVSPSDKAQTIMDKVVNYLAAGTVVWVIYPDDQQAKIYEPGKPFKTVTKEGSLDGGDILPGFKLALKELFTT